MARAKRGFKARRRRKKMLDFAEGFTHRRKNTVRRGYEAVDRAFRYAYRDRKAKKRDFRQLWITRIGAAAVENGLNYNALITGLKRAKVGLDRKILADLAVFDPSVFAVLAQKASSQI